MDKKNFNQYLALIETEQDVRALVGWFQAHPQNKEKTLIISLHFDMEVCLKKENLKFKRISRFIHYEEVKRLWQEGKELALMQKEKVLFPDYLSIFAHALTCQKLIEIILENCREETVLIFPQKKIFYFLWSRMYLNEGVFGALLRCYVKTNKRKYLKTSHSELLYPIKENLKPLVFLFEQLVFCLKPRRFELKHSKKKKTDILFMGWGFDFERHMSLEEIKASKALKDKKVIHIEIKKQQAQASTKADFIFDTEASPNLLVYFKEFFLKEVLPKTIKFFFEKKREKDAYPYLFKNRHLYPLFFKMIFLFNFKVFQIKRYALSLFEALEPSLIVISDIDYLIQRSIIESAKEKKVPVMTTNHGCYDHTTYAENILGDYPTVWGEGVKKYLELSGVKNKTLRVVGNSKYAQIKHHLWDEKKDILILTPGLSENWITSALTEPQMIVTVNGLTDFLCAKNSSKIILKSHPTVDHHSFYDHLLLKDPQKLRHVRKIGFGDILENCRLIVLVGMVTTSLLECLQREIPIVFFGGIYPQQEDWIPLIYQLGACVRSLEEFEQVYNRLEKDPSFRREIIEKGREYFRLFTNYGDNSVENIAAYASEVVDSLKKEVG